MAIPADEVESKRKRRKWKPLAQEMAADDSSPPPPPFPEEEVPPEIEKKINRMVGPLKRSRPEVYEMLEAIAKQTGRKKTVIVSEALHHYFIERKLIQSQLSVADLWEAFDLFTTLQEQAIRNFLRMGMLLFSEEYQSMLELARTLQGPMPAPAKVKLSPKAKDVRERLLDKLWKFADPLLDWCLEQMMKSFAQVMGAKNLPKIKGEPIPVEIIDEEEE